MTVKDRIAKCKLVPVVVIDDAECATATANALKRGTVDVMEITLRTAAGLDAIERVAKECEDVLVGAGTVLSVAQCASAIARGAKFIVSPGYDQELVDYCISREIDIFPGCVTPSEIMAALKSGLSVLKFFPANVYGGVKAIKALAAPFGGVTFMPTGGVGLLNLSEYLIPAVAAIGGGFLCEKKMITEGRYDEITDICLKARAIIDAGA